MNGRKCNARQGLFLKWGDAPPCCLSLAPSKSSRLAGVVVVLKYILLLVVDIFIWIHIYVYVCVGVSLQEITTTRVETVQFAKVHTCTPSTLDEGFVATIVTTSNIKSCLGIAQAKRDDAAMLFLFILSPSFFGISETTSMAGVKRPGPARLAPEVNRVLYIR